MAVPSVATPPIGPPPVPPGKEHVLDATRELGLIVGDPSEYSYQIFVSPHVLRLASPVWSAMLDPSKGWRESSSKTIPLPEDDPDALLVLLQIAHLKFSALPQKISFDLLLKIAVLCDKYDSASLMHPFLNRWVSGVRGTINTPGHEEWLFIAWTFGMENTFTSVSKQLVLNIVRDVNGAIVTPDGTALETDVIMPAGAIESINAVREATLHRMEMLCMNYIDNFGKGLVCRNARNRFECDAIVLGSLVRGLRTNFALMGPPPATYMKWSVTKLKELLSTIKVITYPRTFNENGGVAEAHNSCNLGNDLRQELLKIMNDVPSPLQENHVEHMRRQREKCGVTIVEGVHL